MKSKVEYTTMAPMYKRGIETGNPPLGTENLVMMYRNNFHFFFLTYKTE